MRTFEFLIPRRPLSHQAKDTVHKREWREFVHGRAYRDWSGLPVSDESLSFTLVYLCEADPADINNIIKPVQDALIGLVYTDDHVIIDVRGHLRMLSDSIQLIGLPELLQSAVIAGVECVYVRIESSKPLRDLL